jgi:serine/threonine protein kinase
VKLDDRTVDRLRAEIVAPDLSGTKYRIRSWVGSGGMGDVYLAEDLDLRRNVALKVISLPETTGELSRRMIREARITAGLEHAGIVPVHDVGYLPDGRLFFTMKYVEGHRLDQLMRADWSASDRLRVFQKICEAVAFAHTRGVIHRDLKPENIMVGPFGEVLVMDWGIAKEIAAGNPGDAAAQGDQPGACASHASPRDDNTGDEGAADTGRGAVLGTPYYMSPEQALGRNEDLDETTDVYSLGALLFFLLTGEAPIDPGTTRMTSGKGAGTAGTPTRKIPRPLTAICRRAMSPQPIDRYQTAQGLCDDVVRFLDGKQVTAFRENIIERGSRAFRHNRFIILLVLAYVIMRALVFFLLGR